MDRWWLSCPKFTVLVVTDQRQIVETAPLTRKFVGQPLANLVQWAKRFGNTTIVPLRSCTVAKHKCAVKKLKVSETRSFQGLCQWGKGTVVLAYGGLTPLQVVGGKLTQKDIDQIVRSCCKVIRNTCGLKVVASQTMSGDIITTWGARSAHYMPCQQQPTHGTLEKGAKGTATQTKHGVKGETVQWAKVLLRWLIMHESLGHGLGLQHHEMGWLQSYNPNGNPDSLPDSIFTLHLRNRYGAP